MAFAKRKDSFQKIKKELSKKNACYVLITCSEPSMEGNMEVELSYEGDESLAAYLVDSAQTIFDGTQ